MSTSVSALTNNFFPSAENGFTTTTSGSVSSGAATVGLASVAGYSNGEVVVFVIDPTDATKKQTFTGVIDTAGVQVTSVVWTAGTNQAHALGATVVDYATATHISMMTKGIIQEHNQSGTHSTALITARTEDTDPDPDADYVLTYDTSATALKKVKLQALGAGSAGWTANVVPAPNTITYNGNRSYTSVYSGTDLTGILSPGMRQKFTRTVTAPTQCTSLNGTTQYYSKTTPAGMTFTDDFVVSAWVKLSSYAGASMSIASRYNATSGWDFQIQNTGQVLLAGYNAGAANNSYVTSYQSIPLNKWVHVTAQLDMSAFTATTTTSYVMIDGVDVPASVVRGGTNPTALIQAGNLEIGGRNAGTQPFPGKIAQVAIYSAKVTQANIRATISQGLSGSETSLISAYSFNNSINDLNTGNANNLTANGSAVATNADSPFSVNSFGTPTGTTDYGIITACTFSTDTTVTFQVPEGNTVPTTGGVSAVSYSTQKAPYGMPTQRGKWRVESYYKTQVSQTTPSFGTWYNIGGRQLSIPTGEWAVEWCAELVWTDAGIAFGGVLGTLSNANNTELDKIWSVQAVVVQSSQTQLNTPVAVTPRPVSLASATIYYHNIAAALANLDTIYTSGANGTSIISAECAYL